jgi:hypothetical protein
MPYSQMLRRVALVRTDVLEGPITSVIRTTRIGKLGTTLAVTSNQSTLLTEYFLYVNLAMTSSGRRIINSHMDT